MENSMAFSWTREQQQVIDLRERNILVSAAAGSGKTAVLVERILAKVSDSEHPVDIDRLLIVTFTKAAAGEMRERIRQALEKKVEENPEAVHLQRQLTLIHHAQITTIHSFCLSVIRSYFHTIELDPAFRIGDEGELDLLKADVLEAMLEKHYEKAEDSFIQFVETYATGRDDSGLMDLILQCYDFSRSYPWPDQWLKNTVKQYRMESLSQIEQEDWMKFLMHYIRVQMEEYRTTYDRILAICNEEDGPYPYIEKFSMERERIAEAAKNLKHYSQAAKILSNIKFEIKPRRKKSDNYSQEKADIVSALRENVKTGIKGIIKSYFSKAPEQVLLDLQGAKQAVEQLVALTLEFAEAYTQEKRKRNIVDFHDLEHLALKILVKREVSSDEKGNPTEYIVPTEAADQYAQLFEEVMIDEYQDSNYVQEVILTSVTSERFGRPNLFMVGDVKQSIYKFRLARPELFMEKYETYTTEESKHQKIELHQNFRSRAEVLNSVNYIFYQIMKKQLGDIEYTKEVALHPGLDYEPTNYNVGGKTELWMLSLNGEDLGESEAEEEQLTEREWEARLIAKRIKELTDPDEGQFVWDKEKKEYRRAEYRDIVILLRTIAGWADPFVETLMSQGIPAYAESQNGYFTTIEVQTMLNLLRIIDNPIQDIPFVSVLHSPIVGLSNEQLAQIKLPYSKQMGNGIYGAFCFYMEHFSEDPLGKRLIEFSERLEKWRNASQYMALHELILLLLEETGYYDYVMAMPAGERRKANIDMLVEKAIQYEGMSEHGLFRFIRYIEKLQKFSVDYGEALISGENENTVRIMSIHKSKGLEFPIVILGGASKRFNQQDARSRVVFHSDFGVGVDYINPKLRTRTPTLIKKTFQKKIVMENLGEELRVLYVALTRAKEKLIITSVKRDMRGYIKKRLTQWNDCGMTFLSSALCYLDWLLPVFAKQKGFSEIYKQLEMSAPFTNPYWHDLSPIEATLLEQDELLLSAAREEAAYAISKAVLEQWDSNCCYDEEAAKQIQYQFNFDYHYSDMEKIQAKTSVSQLKRLHLQQEEVTLLVPEGEEQESHIQETIPRFLRQEEKTKQAAWRGTVYHKVLQHLHPTLPVQKKTLEQDLNQLMQTGILTKEERTVIWDMDFVNFYRDELGKQVIKAQQQGTLKTEQQFIIGVTPQELEPNVHGGENDWVMIQGVIDAAIEEEDGWILIDYKTDRVDPEKGVEQLKQRYQIQLDYYKQALERLSQKPVKQQWIYSFALKEGILL